MDHPSRRFDLTASDGKRTSSLVVRAALAFALLIGVQSALALEIPPPPPQWYNDSAGLLDSSHAAALNEKLRSFEQSSGAQFIIYVFPTLESESLEDFTIRCAEKWKVGNKKYDNGLILFVFVKERKVRVEVGYGLEGAVTDAYSSRVIREQIAPHFQSGDYAGGLDAAADALIAKIRGEEPAHEPVQRSRSRSNNGGGTAAFFILIAVIFFMVILPRLFLPRRPGCSGCIWPLLFSGGGTTFGGGGWGGGGGFGGGFGGGGFSGGGGGFGGGGASGGW